MKIDIPYQSPASIIHLFKPWATKPWALFLHSAQRHPERGRYSVIALDPPDRFLAQKHHFWHNEKKIYRHPFGIIREKMQEYSHCYADSASSLTEKKNFYPYEGGLMGVLGYEQASFFEELTLTEKNPPFPWDLALGIYDLCAIFDHMEEKAYIISNGYPETDRSIREKYQKERADFFQESLFSQKNPVPQKPINTPGHPVEKQTVQASWEKSHYLKIIQETQDNIRAGDIFQANIAQHFSLSVAYKAPYDVFEQLCSQNPAPYAAFAVYPEGVFISASPESFIKTQHLNPPIVETAPIKGTIASACDPALDHIAKQQLIQSVKDRAENIMIVDLLRNDLSRISLPGSVQVQSCCALESYASLHHLVSRIQSQLQPSVDWLDLIAATFPGGSISGAPKIRAMEIISALEDRKRGLYCGILFTASFRGSFQSAINIRCIQWNQQHSPAQAHLYAGGGITLCSVPEQEYAESYLKAQKLLSVLNSFF